MHRLPALPPSCTPYSPFQSSVSSARHIIVIHHEMSPYKSHRGLIFRRRFTNDLILLLPRCRLLLRRLLRRLLLGKREGFKAQVRSRVFLRYDRRTRWSEEERFERKEGVKKCTTEGETWVSALVRLVPRDTHRIESIKLSLSLTYKNTYGFIQS